MKNMTIVSIINILGMILLFGVFVLGDDNCPDNELTLMQSNRTLRRKKRYLAFPSGSTFVATITLLKAIQLKEPSNWNLDLEFDMIWPIPNQEQLYRKPHKRIKTIHRTRRHKRDLYAIIERALSSQGLPGKDCVLRTICEANTHLNVPGVSFIEDLIRTVLSHEDSGQNLDKYDIAYRKQQDCHIEYPCPISILELLLNYDSNFFF